MKQSGDQRVKGDPFAGENGASMANPESALRDRRTVPKGVYRFNSHEEADEWMAKMLNRKPSGPHRDA